MKMTHPLNKTIYDNARKMGIKQIILHFSGGNDEEFLNIDITPWPMSGGNNLVDDVQDWAWNVYDYNGDGDGSDFGDDIVYDLENETVTTSDWYMTRTEGDEEEVKMQVEDVS